MIEVWRVKKRGRTSEELIGLLLEAKLGKKPSEKIWRVGRTEKGKPFFPKRPGWHISVSDAGPWWVCAIAEREVGLDLERERPKRGESRADFKKRLCKLAERFFTKDEAAFVKKINSVERFLRIWTAKEAYGKFTGQGIDGEFSTHSVLPEDETLPGEWICGREHYQSLPAPAGYTMTLCHRGKEHVVLREIPDHEFFMDEAIREAEKAAAANEVPIGCVIVKEGEIIARGYNRRNTDGSTLAHAEVSAIRKANRVLKDWRLEGCRMYVTLEPCPMCAGALVQSRIDEVIFGCRNPKAGAAGSVVNLLQQKGFNHKVKTTEGIRGGECRKLLTSFFKKLRK